MKKNLFLVAIAAVAMTSCSNEIDNIVPADNSLKAIEFRALVTRAGTTATDNITNDFNVTAFHENAGTLSTDVYLTSDVTKSTDWVFAGGKKFYWPTSGNLYFFAQYPKNAFATALATTGTTVSYGSYTVSAGADVDVLVAADVTGNSGRTVALAFQHVLSQITFQAINNTSEDIELTINSITLKGVNSKASLSWNGTTFGWTAATTPATYSFDLKSDVDTTPLAENTTTDLASSAGNALMLMPQTLSSVTVEVDYKLYDTEIADYVAGTASSWEKKTVTLSGSWEQNKKYTYGITFNTSSIEFSAPSIADGAWAAEAGSFAQ